MTLFRILPSASALAVFVFVAVEIMPMIVRLVEVTR